MAIVGLPTELGIEGQFICSICRVNLVLNRATAGLVGSDNKQAFACISHFSEPSLLILGWADFSWAERAKYWLRRLEPNDLAYGGPRNAWPSC